MSSTDSANPLPYLDVRVTVLPENRVKIHFVNHAKREIESLIGDLDEAMSLLLQLNKISKNPYTPAISYETYMASHFNKVCEPNDSE